MELRSMLRASLAAGLSAIALGALAQQPPPQYGLAMSIESAKKAAAAAVAEARKINSPSVIAITDPAGDLIYLERMDNTQPASVSIAIGKAKSAARFRRPTKVFTDRLAAGDTYLLGLEGANVVPGGLPIVMGGKLVGAIGVSGGTGAQDVEAASAGAAALK
jgi:glc operon protein GlcG